MPSTFFGGLARIRAALSRRSLDLSTPNATLLTLWRLCGKGQTARAVLCFDGPARLFFEQGFKTNPRLAWLVAWALSDVEHGGYGRIRHYVKFKEKNGQWLIEDVNPALLTSG